MASTPGRGAQVRIDGDAQKAARGVLSPSVEGNRDLKRALEAAGTVADGSTIDGSTQTGVAAEEEVLAPGGVATAAAAVASVAGKVGAVTLGASDLTASGTKDATTYLRGDNTFSAPYGQTTYLGVIATGCQYPGYGGGGLGSVQQAMCRRQMYARDNMRGSQLIYVNFYGSAETSPGATRSITVSIEYPTGTFNRVTFSGGSTTGTIPDGGTLISDALGAWAPPRGAKFKVYTWQSSTATIIGFATSRMVDGMVSGTTTPDLTAAGGTIGANDFTYGPTAIIGQTAYPTAYIIGDSRTESSYNVPTLNDNGNLARSISGAAAYINTAVFGESLFQQLSQTTKRRAFSAYCSHILLASGVNTLTSDVVSSALSQITSIAALFGNKPFYCSTIEPYTSQITPTLTSLTQTGGVATATMPSAATLTTGASVTIAGATPAAFNGTKVITVVDSTHFTFTIAGGTTSPATGTITYNDLYGSPENQGIDPVAGVTAKIFAFNEAVRAGITGVHGFFDLARVARNPTDPNKWATPAYTTDGLHGTAKYCLAVQGSGVVNPALLGPVGNIPPLG
jgi:hypothetical protein